MRSILMTPEEVRQQIFLMTPTLRAAACISLLAIAGCTTLQVYGQNKSNQKIAFVAKVGDKEKFESEVDASNNLAAMKVGNFFPG
jgi:predicted aminopeptidase